MPSLAEKMAGFANPVEMLRRSQAGIYVYPVVAAEFANWRDEQRAWRESAVLFDQSHHMDELIVEGPQATEFLAHYGINSFADFGTDRAKHYVAVAPSGHVIGDTIAFREAEQRYLLVGRAPVPHWLMFAAAVGRWNVRLRHDPRSPSRPEGERVLRLHYRFQIQGPQAPQVLERAHGGPLPEIPFFRTGWIRIGSRRVRALRHGMAGAPGLEIWGPYEDRSYILSTLLEAAHDAGVALVRCGSRAYSTNTLESGWIPSPLPAIYSGDGMLAEYRAWLADDMYEAAGSLGGSFVSDNIEDYYVDPFELGYGFYIGWKKTDFVGKEALARLKDRPHRRKVTFEWHREDVLKVVATAFEPGTPCKWIDFPQPNYASTMADMVLHEGRMVGMSMFNGYSFNERALLSLGVVDPDIRDGDVLTLVWGEPDDTGKPATEKHRQAEIRVRVSPVPYARTAREAYAPGSWRTRGQA